MKRALLLISLVLSVVVPSCLPRAARREFAGCPPPPPPPSCSPVRIDAIAIDTSSAGVIAPETFWKISVVRGANTREDEFALLPGGSVDVLLWGVNMARDQYVTVERVQVDSIARVPGASSSTRPWSVVRSSDIMGDASLAMTSVRNDALVVDSILPAPVNTPIYWDAQPTTTHDGSVMIFASDREGGMGGTDLWYTKRTAHGWSDPVNMGPLVNTPCDELSPFMVSGDTTLLFSSAGWQTVGGYDLFRASLRITNGAPVVTDTARNIGAPVNTRFDEMFPYVPEGKTDWPLYYASNQLRTFDIWVIHRVPGPSIGTPRERTRPPAVALLSPVMMTPTPDEAPPPPAPEPTPVVPVVPPPTSTAPAMATLTGTVMKEQTQLPVVGADVLAHPVGAPEQLSQTKTDAQGRYALKVPAGKNIEVSAQTAESFFDSRVIDVPETMVDSVITVPSFVIPITFYLRINFPTAVFNDPYPNTLDSNGIETTTTWQSALDLIAANIRVTGASLRRMVLIGHTDDVGTDASNEKLGRERVQFVIDQLVARGVARELLEGRSAGESLLPARRKAEPVDVWRKRARRVELVKVMR